MAFTWRETRKYISQDWVDSKQVSSKKKLPLETTGSGMRRLV